MTESVPEGNPIEQPMTAQADQQQMAAQQQEDLVYTGQKLDSSKLKDRKYKGEDYQVDLALQNGCVRKRKCTDVLCCCFFLVFFICMITVSIWGYANGNLEVALSPVNGYGGFCGHNYPKTSDDKFNNEGFPYLFIYDLSAAIEASDNSDNFWAYGVCVSSCPDSYNSNVSCSPQSNNDVSDCSTGDYGYPTYESLSYCVPEDLEGSQQTQWDNFYNANKSDYSTKFVLDVYREKWIILMGIGFTIVYTFIYIGFMDKCAVCISWASVFIIQVSLVVLGIGVFEWGQDIEKNTGSSNAPWLNFLAVMFWFFGCLFCLCLLCNCKSLRISFAIIETAAEFFSQTKRIIVVPFLFFFLGVIFFLTWLFGLMCIATAGTVEPQPYAHKGTIFDTYTQHVTIIHNTSTANGWYIFYMFVGLIWVSAFLVSCNDFVIMVSAISWYFSRKTDGGEEGHSNVWEGFHWIYRYNGGTLVFGSIILSFVWIIRGFFDWLGEKLHEKHHENACARCCLATCLCCLDCTDRFIRYLTENAYIYCALSSDAFCSSALHSFMLMLKNSAKFAFVASVSNIFMILAKMSVAFLVVLTCWGIMLPMDSGVAVLDEAFGPLFVIFLVSYIVCAIFIGVFHTSANTILQCFLVDREVSHRLGHVDDSHVPHALRKFLDEHCEENQIKKDGVVAEENQEALMAEDQAAAQKEVF